MLTFLFPLLPGYPEQLLKAPMVELSVANALWMPTNFPVHPHFVKRAQELLSEARNLDFSDAQAEQSRQAINLWVEAATKNKIKDLLPIGYMHHDTQHDYTKFHVTYVNTSRYDA
jgi:serine protease inhibitor